MWSGFRGGGGRSERHRLSDACGPRSSRLRPFAKSYCANRISSLMFKKLAALGAHLQPAQNSLWPRCSSVGEPAPQPLHALPDEIFDSVDSRTNFWQTLYVTICFLIFVICPCPRLHFNDSGDTSSNLAIDILVRFAPLFLALH